MLKRIVYCEMHIDPTARELLLNTLPFLMALGYRHVGFEHDADKEIEFEIQTLKKHLLKGKKLAALLESGFAHEKLPGSDLYPLLALKSDTILHKLLETIKRHSELSYHGLDITLGDRFNLTREELTAKVSDNLQVRDKTIAENILALPVNSVAIIGAEHMRGVQTYLIEKLGQKTAMDNFCFLVPFAEVLDVDIDCRARMLELLLAGNVAQLKSRYCPLGGYFLNKYPPDNDPSYTIENESKRRIVEVCQLKNINLEEKSSSCCGLFSFFFDFLRAKNIQHSYQQNTHDNEEGRSLKKNL
jgi:hypothetical protein